MWRKGKFDGEGIVCVRVFPPSGTQSSFPYLRWSNAWTILESGKGGRGVGIYVLNGRRRFWVSRDGLGMVVWNFFFGGGICGGWVGNGREEVERGGGLYMSTISVGLSRCSFVDR